MSGPAFVAEQAVRDYINLEDDDGSGSSKYSSATIASNLRAAGYFLQKATGRQFENQPATTKKFTTEGATSLAIPGLRTAITVTRAGSTLTEDESFWLIPDAMQTGVSTAIQFGAFRNRGDGPWYLHSSEWFDRGYDHPRFGAYARNSLPNDLEIAGDWGLLPADYPEPLLHTTKVLAAWYTKRPDALLSGAIQTQDGNVFDLSRYPIEVQSFVAEWKIGTQAVSVG